MRVVVDPEQCLSTGMCTTIAPDLFELGQDGALRVLVDLLTSEQVEAAEDAVACCPVEALSLDRAR